MADPTKPDPSTPSSSYAAMKPALDMITAILKGASAVREGAETYLPRYPAEDAGDYRARLASAPWRPEFEDALRNISSRPFTKEIAVQGQTSESVRSLLEDVDTMGNNLQRFARVAFNGGIAKGYHGILVDFPVTEPNATLAEERQSGARPYWVQVAAEDLVACYTAVVNGRTVITHARILERIVARDGFDEMAIKQVRVLEPGTWEIWRQSDNDEWFLYQNGTVALTEVPLVIFYAGQRDGEMVRPPLLNLADMQIELYRALSRQDEILTYAGSPMLAANGMAQGDDPVVVGPRRILYAPSSEVGGTPNWQWIQPDAANIQAVAAHVQSIIDDMKRLGLQPLTPKSGTVTATGQAIEGAKAHSAVQDWATAFKDVLEQTLVYTAQWLGEESSAEVSIHTDFGADIDGGADMAELLKVRMAGEISRATYWDELVRRGKLGPQFDPEAEQRRLEEEGSVEDEAEAEADPELVMAA